MKSIWLIIILGLTTVACASEAEQHVRDESSAAKNSTNKLAVIVDGHLKAYNNHDLEGMFKYFHSDIESYNFAGELELQGVDAFRQAFAGSFDAKPKEVVIERIIDKNYVIDKVEVNFTVNDQTVTERGVVIYTIENDLIRKLTFL